MARVCWGNRENSLHALCCSVRIDTIEQAIQLVVGVLFLRCIISYRTHPGTWYIPVLLLKSSVYRLPLLYVRDSDKARVLYCSLETDKRCRKCLFDNKHDGIRSCRMLARVHNMIAIVGETPREKLDRRLAYRDRWRGGGLHKQPNPRFDAH